MAGLTKKLTGNVATVFNGMGFLSRHVIGRLGQAGAQLVIAHRGSPYFDEKLRVAGGLGQVYFAHYHLKDEESLYKAMQYSNVVVNCIGQMNETKNFSFDELYIDGSRRMARIAREVGVEKFIHISSLNVSPNPKPHLLKTGSRVLKAKYFGELAVREEFPEAIIFRPADMVGEQDDFINHYTSLVRQRLTHTVAIWDYYDGVTKQPVFVRDVAKAIEYAISDRSADGKTFQAVGPYRYDFYDLIEYIRACGGVGAKNGDGTISNLRWDFLMRAIITITNKLQKRPYYTWERVERDLTTDYVDPRLPTLKDLGVELTPLEEHIKMYAFYRPREIRYEIPFEASERIDRPRRLNEAMAI